MSYATTYPFLVRCYGRGKPVTHLADLRGEALCGVRLYDAWNLSQSTLPLDPARRLRLMIPSEAHELIGGVLFRETWEALPLDNVVTDLGSRLVAVWPDGHGTRMKVILCYLDNIDC